MSTIAGPKIIRDSSLILNLDPANPKSYPAGLDPYVNNVSLMLDGESLTDKSLNNLPITNNGVTVSSAQYKYGSNSLSFDGNSYMYVTPASAIVFGTDDFTIEFWIYLNSVTTYNVFDQRTSEPQIAPSLAVITNAFRYYVNGTDRIIGSTLSAQTWYHVALVRSSGNTKLYINGTQSGSTYADTNNYIGPNFWLGAYPPNPASNKLNGYIDDFKVTKFARYTSNFIPPAGPSVLPNISIDLTKNKNSTTYASGTTFSSSNAGSIAFNGTAGSGIISNVLNVAPTSIFTVCCWAKWNTTATSGGARRPAVGISTITNSFEFALGFPYTYSSSKLGLEVGKAGVASQIAYSINSAPTGVWYHLAGVFMNGSGSFYLNGVFQNTVTYSATVNSATTGSGNWLIGTELYNGNTSTNTIGPMNGNVGAITAYNRALSANEIFQNYNAEMARFGY